MPAETYQLLIGGKWTEAASGERFAVTNPATGEVVATVPDAGAEDARAAIEAAHAAFAEWSALPAHVRARYMRKVYDGIMQNVDRLARVLTEENGKPLAEAKGEVINGAEYLNWYAEETRRVYGEVIPSSSRKTRIWVLRQPVGVVAAITPWNFPSSMITRKIAPALAAGCTVVIKPAEQTPLSALLLGEIIQEAGLPAGVVNIVTTSQPAAVGKEFLENRLVRKISFTGSTEVGKYLMQGAAAQMKRVSMELGGHAPFIVFDDADLDAAVQGAVISKFRNAGQTCICANRIYVQESVAEAFTERLVEAVRKLRVGNGFEEGTSVGPLIDEAAYRKVEEHVSDSLSKGARVLTGGHRLTGAGFDRGYFYAPTLLDQVSDDMRIVREETFGPVAPIMTFRTEDEVIRRANDTPYGLAAYIFTRNLGRTVRVSEALEYGMVAVNDSLLAVPQAPFGGIKESGLGREGGHHGLDDYLEYKYLSVVLDE
ncbi:succinate-semialdehyde dehydrogenase/glutarate-semialdehyde dehydrogenase [Symbiobacterium terraclitae]|uniref:Aldehyde dehydrogenase n=1 Tax=Symbiobacterium terraclitae TaxID=557451 RepID=A0ABS4JTH3_9FIRM|nr:succinate-semialdehyde dehydrogenase/glutarate-semialdehyde dehydrogenase [Symbiobacterium terraclitae]